MAWHHHGNFLSRILFFTSAKLFSVEKFSRSNFRGQVGDSPIFVDSSAWKLVGALSLLMRFAGSPENVIHSTFSDRNDFSRNYITTRRRCYENFHKPALVGRPQGRPCCWRTDPRLKPFSVANSITKTTRNCKTNRNASCNHLWRLSLTSSLITSGTDSRFRWARGKIKIKFAKQRENRSARWKNSRSLKWKLFWCRSSESQQWRVCEKPQVWLRN